MLEDDRIRESVARWKRRSQQQHATDGCQLAQFLRFCGVTGVVLLACAISYLVGANWPPRPEDVGFGTGASMIVVLATYCLTKNLRIATTTFAASLMLATWWVVDPPTNPDDWVWLAHFAGLGVIELLLLRYLITRPDGPLSSAWHGTFWDKQTGRVGVDGPDRFRSWFRSRFPGAD
jgi:hypothetical protein